MHIPHMVCPSFLSSEKAFAWPWQALMSIISSREREGDHSLPVGAKTGQAKRQQLQLPQKDCSTGFPAGRGASVMTVHNLTADPNSRVTSKAHLPIQPRPERVAAVL